MITLRDQARMDTAIGAITMQECKLISTILKAVSESWFLRLLLPSGIRHRTLEMAMLAATLDRTPQERIPLESQIRLAMERGMN